MARNINGGTDQVSIGSVTRFTIGSAALRFKTTQTTANTHLASHMSATSRNGWGLFLNAAANKITAWAWATTAAQTVGISSTTSINDGNWHSVVFNWNCTNGQTNTLFIDGAQEGTNNSNATWNSVTAYFPVLGDSFDAFWASPVADCADFAIWNAHLTADEVAAYARGGSPTIIKPASLVMHTPLVRDVKNLKEPFAGSVTGTSVSAHPRVIGGQV
jgi:hypothetical protein